MIQRFDFQNDLLLDCRNFVSARQASLAVSGIILPNAIMEYVRKFNDSIYFRNNCLYSVRIFLSSTWRYAT
jgi:hypothetical protein